MADEYIKRSDAIDAICRGCEEYDRCEMPCSYAVGVAELPAADVAPVKRGKWEDVEIWETDTSVVDVVSMRCPVCNRYHNEVYHYGNPTEMAHYCGFCGAKMGGDGE